MPTILTAQYFYLYHPEKGFFTGFKSKPNFDPSKPSWAPGNRVVPEWHAEPNMPMGLVLYPNQALAEEAVDQIVGCFPPDDVSMVTPPVIYPLALPMPAR